jgi:hypothetical protein
MAEKDNDGFSSLSVYSSLEVITAKTPEDLRDILRQIKTPIKIINITAMNSRYTAWIIGDIRIKRTQKGK